MKIHKYTIFTILIFYYHVNIAIDCIIFSESAPSLSKLLNSFSKLNYTKFNTYIFYNNTNNKEYYNDLINDYPRYKFILKKELKIQLPKIIDKLKSTFTIITKDRFYIKSAYNVNKFIKHLNIKKIFCGSLIKKPLYLKNIFYKYNALDMNIYNTKALKTNLYQLNLKNVNSLCKSLYKLFIKNKQINFINKQILSTEQLPYKGSSKELFRCLKKYLPNDPVIIEAGAYQGNDTIALSKHWPNGKIYAFEPVPQIFNQLKNKTQNYINIKIYQLALSNKNGMCKFYTSEEQNLPNVFSQSGSIIKPTGHLKYSSTLFKKTIKINTIKLDTWANENSINKIDLLWLDLQGHEYKVLKKSNIIKNTRLIYTEIANKQLFKNQILYKNFKKWLIKQGFKLIAKDFWPHWWDGNALFINKNIT